MNVTRTVEYLVRNAAHTLDLYDDRAITCGAHLCMRKGMDAHIHLYATGEIDWLNAW